jgi:hypothetical protein
MRNEPVKTPPEIEQSCDAIDPGTLLITQIESPGENPVPETEIVAPT